MSDQPTPATPAAPETPAETPPAPVPAPPAAPAAPAAPAEPSATPENVEDLPDWAQKELRDTRKEAQGLRKRQDDAIATAVEQAKQELTTQLGKSLGLIKDDEAADPQALVAAATERGNQAAAEARTARIELAVHRAAETRDIADALLDSRAFEQKVAALDPSAADFPALVAEAVQAEVSANPSRYRTQPPAAAANTSGAPVTGQPATTPTSIEAMRKSYAEARGERP